MTKDELIERLRPYPGSAEIFLCAADLDGVQDDNEGLLEDLLFEDGEITLFNFEMP